MLLLDGLTYLPVGVVAAAAYRLLGLRLDIGGPAHAIDQYLFDQTGAGAAGTRSLGVLLHFFDGEKALLPNRLHDGSLGDAIAAANLHAIGHAGYAALARYAGIANRAFPEHQVLAQFGDRPCFADQTEVPSAIHGVAVQAGTDQLVILDDELLVDTADRIGKRNGLRVVAAMEVAGREHVDAGDLQLGRRGAARVATDTELRKVIGRHFSLLK